MAYTAGFTMQSTLGLIMAAMMQTRKYAQGGLSKKIVCWLVPGLKYEWSPLTSVG